MPRVRSNIWKVFIKTPSGGKCKLCNCDVKSGEGTTNLRKHLTRRHPNYKIDESQTKKPEASSTAGPSSSATEIQSFVSLDSEDKDTKKDVITEPVPLRSTSVLEGEFMDQDSSCSDTAETISNPAKTPKTRFYQPQISEVFSEMSSYSGGEKSGKITNAITFMIVKDNLPLNTTEKEGMKLLMKTVAPLYTMPGRKAITHIIDQKYELLSASVKSKIREINNMTLSTDIWTETMSTTSYLSLTLHFYLKKNLHSITIGVQELDERHTADYIGNCLQSLCEEWNIDLDKVTAVVTDNGSNIVKAVSNIFGKNKSLPCFAHTLDLVASKIMYEVDIAKNIIEKIKHIVTYFKQSVVATDKLRKAQDGDTSLKLIQSVPTRWNSAFYMIERFLQLSRFVAPILLENSKAPNMIDAMELEICGEILQILKPIEQVSKEISGEKYLTASKIIPIINCLIKKLEKYAPSTDTAKALHSATIKELDKRFGAVEKVHLLATATLLDPRFKKLHFNNIVACSQVLNYVSDLCKADVPANPIPQEEIEFEPEPDSVWTFHQELIKKPHSHHQGETHLDEGIIPI